MRSQLKPAFFLLLLTLLLHFGSCGGNGNAPGGGPSSPAIPPTVLSTNPPDGASLSDGHPITVTFSKEMDPASLNPATFKISGVSGTVAAGGKSASFIPDPSLPRSGSYTATVTREARDLAGNPLAADYVWRFTTGNDSGPAPLFVSPASLAFLAVTGGPLPSPQRLTLSPAGGGKFNGSISGNASWLTENRSSGTDLNGVTISMTTTALAPGNYQGAITITPSGAQEAPTRIPVSYTLTPVSPPAACSGRARPPYIAFDTPTTATIAWECGPQGTVEWGASRLDRRADDNLTGKDKHFVTLSSLTPDTSYLYRVTVNGGLLGQGSFQTAKPAGDNRFSFVAFGDSGDGSPEQTALASLMERLTFSFAIIAGDVVYDSGEEEEFGPHYFIPYRALIDHLPFFPVAGNHDVRVDRGITFLSNFYHPSGKLYYDFHWGDTHLINLHSTDAEDPEQKAWLERTLASSRSLWKIVYFHHPVYSNGEYGGYAFIEEQFVPLFEQYQVDLVFTAHDHDYERSCPILAKRCAAGGITYLVTGGGGAGLRAVGRSDLTAFSQSVHHLVRAEMSGRSLTLNALDSTGTVFDSVTLTK